MGAKSNLKLYKKFYYVIAISKNLIGNSSKSQKDSQFASKFTTSFLVVVIWHLFCSQSEKFSNIFRECREMEYFSK